MNGSSYTNEEDLEFTTLEDVVYMKMKDDVSFLLVHSFLQWQVVRNEWGLYEAKTITVL